MRSEHEVRLPVADGESIACRWRQPGAGRPPILYLHGFGSSQAGEKAEYFRRRSGEEELGFLSLDFRGHGVSDGDLRRLTLSRCLADVAAARSFLADEGAERVIVMGSSMGALVGLWHAAGAPSGLAAGLYVAPAIGLAESLADRLGAEGLSRWRATGSTSFTDELGTHEVGWDLYRDLERHPTERLAASHRVPSLLFQGRRDDRVSWRRVARFAETARGPARLHLFPDGDHRLLAQRDEIWEGMLAFVAELGGRGTGC